MAVAVGVGVGARTRMCAVLVSDRQYFEPPSIPMLLWRVRRQQLRLAARRRLLSSVLRNSSFCDFCDPVVSRAQRSDDSIALSMVSVSAVRVAHVVVSSNEFWQDVPFGQWVELLPTLERRRRTPG